MNPVVDPTTLPGYWIGCVIGAAIPIAVVVGVLVMTVTGIRHAILGVAIIAATDARIKAHSQARQDGMR